LYLKKLKKTETEQSGSSGYRIQTHPIAFSEAKIVAMEKEEEKKWLSRLMKLKGYEIEKKDSIFEVKKYDPGM